MSEELEAWKHLKKTYMRGVNHKAVQVVEEALKDYIALKAENEKLKADLHKALIKLEEE